MVSSRNDVEQKFHTDDVSLPLPDLGSASDWLKPISLQVQPIRSATQIWVLRRHQYGISALVSHTSFRGESSGGVANFIGRFFFQANGWLVCVK